MIAAGHRQLAEEESITTSYELCMAMLSLDAAENGTGVGLRGVEVDDHQLLLRLVEVRVSDALHPFHHRLNPLPTSLVENFIEVNYRIDFYYSARWSSSYRHRRVSRLLYPGRYKAMPIPRWIS